MELHDNSNKNETLVQVDRISGSMLLSAGESDQIKNSTNESEAFSFGDTKGQIWRKFTVLQALRQEFMTLYNV
jgi:hypothetical protein